MARLIKRPSPQASKWIRREPSADASARLFCLPYSGCGATMYRLWPESTGPVEVLPVQLPGREGRFREPHYGTYEKLADQLIEGLAGYFDKPFAFFGHCSSALPAYEISVQLLERGMPMPANMFVSSQVAPHEGPYGRFLDLPDEGLREEMRKLAAVMGGALIEDVVDVYLEIMRADVQANKHYRQDAVRLPHPVTAIGWDQDDEVEPGLMTGWAACGQPTRFTVLSGPHHTFLQAPEALLSVIRDGFGFGERAIADGEPA